MARPKVKPQDRRRSVRACDSCKSSKKRCDGNLPCSLCLKKGVDVACAYSSPARGSRGPSDTTRVEVRNPSPDSGLSTPFRNVSRLRYEDTSGTSSEQPQSRLDQAGHHVAGTPWSTTGRALGQRPVMLTSVSGDKVFVGSTAAISFLRFLQKTMKQFVGPSGFTDRQHSYNFFEQDAAELEGESFYDSLTDEAKETLVQCFLDASSGLLDLFTSQELKRFHELAKAHVDGEYAGTQPKERAGIASLYLMIAIGAQCRGESRDDLVCAAKYFSQARKMAFERMLEDPTVNLVRTFILMAFYMLGASSRNAAFMYTGIASKAADILGLHVVAHYKHMSPQERASRLRTAKSLRVFDIICSSILGRHCTAPSLRQVDDYIDETDNEPKDHRGIALTAANEACSVLQMIVDQSGGDGNLNNESIENLLQMLQEWSQALPPSLRQLPKGDGTDSPTQDRELVTGNVHVAGTYYFGIILLTRQSLIQHILPQLSGQSAVQEGVGQASAKILADRSKACVESAFLLAQMCREALDAGMFLGNMIIIKAWIFAAGLVLGFSILVDSDAIDEYRDAFQSAQYVLGAIKKLSAQAGRYSSILSSFSDAIEQYKNQARRERQAARPSLVERIFSLNPSQQPSGDPQLSGSQLPTPESTSFTGPSSRWRPGDEMTPFVPMIPDPSASDEPMLRMFWDRLTTDFGEIVLPGAGDFPLGPPGSEFTEATEWTLM